jgi:hypothetical protein
MGIDKPANIYISQGEVNKFGVVGYIYIYIYIYIYVCVCGSPRYPHYGWVDHKKSSLGRSPSYYYYGLRWLKVLSMIRVKDWI